jgi:uncharacterized protein
MSTEIQIPSSGQRYEGELTSDLPLLQGWSWPYVAITGKQDGPRTTITAGVHGCEYVSIYAAMRLGRELSPDEVRGQVVVVPVVNPPSFWERTAFVNPFDGKNPNRFFPGRAGGTFTEVMDYFIFNTCILPNDAYIDLHGGDIVEELMPFTGYTADADPEVSSLARKIAEAFALDLTIPRHGQLGPLPQFTYAAAAQQGVAGVLAEAGGIGQLTMPDVDLLVDGTRRGLQAAGNLPGEPNPPKPTRHIEKSETLFAGNAGFWICDVSAGDEVKSGQRVGQIFTLLGDLIETVEAPFDGVVVYRTTSAAMKQGGLMMSIGA